MKQYPGYTLVKREDCPEQHGTLTVLTHDVSVQRIGLLQFLQIWLIMKIK